MEKSDNDYVSRMSQNLEGWNTQDKEVNIPKGK